MSAITKINWTDATWNPVTGCTPAGVGCAHCYAKRVAERFPAVHGVEYSSPSLTSTATCPTPFSTVICHPERLGIPERWRKPRAIMCPSMGDLFHADVSLSFIWDVLGVIDRCLHHTFIVLTKRPERARDVLGNWTKLPNVVLGVSCSTQAEADHAIPILLNTPANRRIVSLEPLVGPVDLCDLPARDCSVPHPLPFGWVLPERFCALTGQRREKDEVNMHGLFRTLDGVIVGGESGPGARPMHPDWVRSLRDQCEAAGVPFFFKQWGEWAPNCLCDTKRAHRTTPRPEPGKPGCMFHCGRSRAGRLLDGRTHDALCWDVRGKGEA